MQHTRGFATPSLSCGVVVIRLLAGTYVLLRNEPVLRHTAQPVVMMQKYANESQIDLAHTAQQRMGKDTEHP